MLISETRKFIYIAVPKTGSTSVEAQLMALDPQIRRNKVPRPDGTWITVHKHATAAEIRRHMGENMNDYTVIAFIRSPISTVVSKYYHYRLGRGAERARQLSFSRRAVGLQLRVLSTFLLPLHIWTLLYPYSKTHEFLLGGDGEILVDEIGDFSKLQEDFNMIFGNLGFDAKELALPMTNKSKYSSKRHEDDALLRRIVRWKSRIDVGIFKNHSVSANAASKHSVGADWDG